MCAYNILNMFVNNKYLALNKISAKDLIRKLTDCVMVARRPLSPPLRSAGLLTSRRPDWPAVSEQSLNSPRPDLDPSVPGQRKYPGTLQGWIGQRGQRAGRGRGGELACWETPRHLVILSPVLACCDGRRAQSWFVKAVSCLPTSPHLGSAQGTTGHNLGAEILLTTAPTTNQQGDQKYNIVNNLVQSYVLTTPLQSHCCSGDKIFFSLFI